MTQGLGPYTDRVADQLYGDDDGIAEPVVGKNVDTPPTTNVNGYVAYRGSEQHGVRFDPDSEREHKFNKYAAEQQAFETYIDPTVTPRDIVPGAPLAVALVNNPDLLYRKQSRIRTLFVPANTGPLLLVPDDWNRSRMIIRASAALASTLYLKTKDDGNQTLDAIPTVITAGAVANVLESFATTSFYVSAGAADIQVHIYTEYLVFNGHPLINGAKNASDG